MNPEPRPTREGLSAVVFVSFYFTAKYYSLLVLARTCWADDYIIASRPSWKLSCRRLWDWKNLEGVLALSVHA